jgi:hypothetical protein
VAVVDAGTTRLGSALYIMDAIKLPPDRKLAPMNGERVIHFAFILLFPGFFFYQTLLGLGLIGAFLGGYFTLVALVLTPSLIFSCRAAVKAHKIVVSQLDLFCFLFIIYWCLILAINVAGGADTMIAQRHLQSIIFCVDTYIIFRMSNFNHKKLIVLLVVSLLVMSAITIYMSIDGFFYLQALGQAKNPESLATYQGFARSYIYTYLIVVSLARSIGARFILYGLATTTLFLNGARSEFSAVLFSIPLIELYYTKHKLATIIPIVLVLMAFMMNAEAIVGMLPENRTLQLLDLSHSTSAMARRNLSSDAWRTITENPIFGDFASYPDGHYAHNVLGAWVDFGIVGFVFFSALLIWPAVLMFANGFFHRTKSSEFIIAMSFTCITIIWAVTAKNVPDMSVGAALGAFAKYYYGKRIGQEHSSYSRAP